MSHEKRVITVGNVIAAQGTYVLRQINHAVIAVYIAVTAIENAREKGYRLKIYEAFRPHEASVYMYRKF